MLAFAAMPVFNAFHEFTEGALLPGIDNACWTHEPMPGARPH